MSVLIEQVIDRNSYGISEYARQLDHWINSTDGCRGRIRSIRDPLANDSIVIYHFSNATRSVLISIAKKKSKKEQNMVIVHDVLPRSKWVQGLSPAFLGIIHRNAARIIVHTEAAKKILLSAFPGIKEEKVVVIPHGTFIYDPPSGEKERLRKQYGFREDDKILFLLGGITKARGQLKFLQAFTAAGVGERHPRLHLIVSGKCNDRKAEALMAKNSAIHYHGFAQNGDVREFYTMCDASVVYRERSVGESSSTIAYSLGYGRPVLASDTPTFREMIGGSGILFENNENAIIDLMGRFVAEEIDIVSLEKEAKHLRELYKWENYLQKILAISKGTPLVSSRMDHPGKE